MLITMLPAQALAVSDSSEDVSSVPAIERIESGESIDVDFLQEDSDLAIGFPESDSSESVKSTDEDTSLPNGKIDGDSFTDSELTDTNESPESASTELGNKDDKETSSVEESATLPAALSDNSFVSGDYTYTLSDGKATIIGYSGNGGSITVPSSLDGYMVVSIGNSAFYNKVSIQAVVLPETLTSLGSSAFYNCTALTSVYVPSSLREVTSPNFGPFAGCSQMDSISFGTGITKIPANLFKDCTGLTHITIPDTVTSIGSSAFYGCLNLRTVQFSRSLTGIGNEAFHHCSSLTTAQLPEGLVSLGSSAFYNCSALTNVNIPSSLREVTSPNFGPFAECSQMDSISFGTGITKIPANLFKDCTGLTHITIPDTVTSIGSAAFSSCTNLKHTMIGNVSCTIADNAFSNCPELTLYCPYASLTTIYAIDHDILFEPSGVLVDNNTYALNYSSTGLFADINGMSANGYITITLNYNIKDIWVIHVSDLAAKIRLPSHMMLDEDTIKVDGIICTNYTLRDNALTIPLSKTSGAIKLSVKVTQQGNVTSYATMTMKKDGANAEEIIGVLNESTALLTLNLPSETAQDTFTANGLAPASSTVTLYVDGDQSTFVTASKAGNWTAQISIPNPINNYSYSILASCTAGGETTTQTSSIVYKENLASMTGFTLKFNEHNVIKSCDLLHTNGIKPSITFAN